MAFTIMNWAGAAFMVGMATLLWGAIVGLLVCTACAIWEVINDR